MKKIILLGALALGVMATMQEPASAWLNFKFGAGINWAWQSGGNNVLWGFFRNGQPPGFGPQFDPSACTGGPNQPGCGNYGCQQGGPYFSQPSCGPQMQQCPTGQCPTGQCPTGQYPYFPGLYPYSQDQFQFFGSAPTQPGSNAGGDGQVAANQNKAPYMTAQLQNQSQNWFNQYRATASYPYSANYNPSTSYYPSTTSSTSYYGSTSYYPSYPSTSYYPAYYPTSYGYQPYSSQSYYGYGYYRR